MNTETETMVNVIKSRLEKMADYERVIIFNAITDGYCIYCGEKNKLQLYMWTW